MSCVVLNLDFLTSSITIVAFGKNEIPGLSLPESYTWTNLIVGRLVGVKIKGRKLKYLVLKKPNMKESESSVCKKTRWIQPWQERCVA